MREYERRTWLTNRHGCAWREEVCWLPAVVDWLEGLETPAGQPRDSWTDNPTDDSQRRSEIDRIEVEPEAGHLVVSIGEDLGPLTLETPPASHGRGYSELLDQHVAIDADHPRGELDVPNAAKHPVEPSTHPVMPAETNTEQLNGAIFGETGYDPLAIPGFEGLIEFQCGLANRRLGLHNASVSALPITRSRAETNTRPPAQGHG